MLDTKHLSAEERHILEVALSSARRQDHLNGTCNPRRCPECIEEDRSFHDGEQERDLEREEYEERCNEV
jgi:hypothetical protein